MSNVERKEKRLGVSSGHSNTVTEDLRKEPDPSMRKSVNDGDVGSDTSNTETGQCCQMRRQIKVWTV